MKRSYENITDYIPTSMNYGEPSPSSRKVLLVEREFQPNGISLLNPIAIARKSYVENMELADDMSKADSFVRANAVNKLDIIGRQMKHLQELMVDVLKETKLNNELHNVACNFVKKPGHIYHLYQRISGQQYFSMLSPQEWVSPPHEFLGSYRLEADHSWTPLGSVTGKYEGLAYLQEIHFGMKPALTNY